VFGFCLFSLPSRCLPVKPSASNAALPNQEAEAEVVVIMEDVEAVVAAAVAVVVVVAAVVDSPRNINRYHSLNFL